MADMHAYQNVIYDTNRHLDVNGHQILIRAWVIIKLHHLAEFYHHLTITAHEHLTVHFDHVDSHLGCTSCEPNN